MHPLGMLGYAYLAHLLVLPWCPSVAWVMLEYWLTRTPWLRVERRICPIWQLPGIPGVYGGQTDKGICPLTSATTPAFISTNTHGKKKIHFFAESWTVTF